MPKYKEFESPTENEINEFIKNKKIIHFTISQYHAREQGPYSEYDNYYKTVAFIYEEGENNAEG